MIQGSIAEGLHNAEHSAHEPSDPMESKEYEVEQTLRNLMESVKDLDLLRVSNEGRGILAHPECVFDLELSRDKLSRILDDVRGVS